MKQTEQLVFKLEKHLISPEKWTDEIIGIFPKEIQEDLRAKDYPIGIGYYEETGWFCLASGQGPYIVWMQNA